MEANKMDKLGYISPNLNVFQLNCRAICQTSDYGQDPEGKGEDFNWGN